VPQRGEEGHGAPAAVRHLGDEPLAPGGATVAAGHVDLSPGLVDEDEARRVKPALMALPADALGGDVRPVLLAGAQAFMGWPVPSLGSHHGCR
jgi:hypothetical protein